METSQVWNLWVLLLVGMEENFASDNPSSFLGMLMGIWIGKGPPTKARDYPSSEEVYKWNLWKVQGYTPTPENKI